MYLGLSGKRHPECCRIHMSNSEVIIVHEKNVTVILVLVARLNRK